MPTATGHTTAIRASKVKGTSVYSTSGDKIGHVEDVILVERVDDVGVARRLVHEDQVLGAGLGRCGRRGDRARAREADHTETRTHGRRWYGPSRNGVNAAEIRSCALSVGGAMGR